MLETFNKHIREEQLLDADAKVLLAVSAGVDSVVMAELFRQRGQECIIAHCNFSLRGQDSDNDEKFTRALAGRFGMPFFSKRFDISSEMDVNSGSVQMVARELRYSWFTELANREACTHIALAHHLDDQAETFLLNLSRGSGLKGLSGMPVKRGKIIRPLLYVRRAEILRYARMQGLEWREDRSNTSRKYLRNRLRHETLPQLEEVLPNFTDKLLDSLRILKGAGIAAAAYADQLRETYLTEDDGTLFLRHPGPGINESLATYLVHEWLQVYGFSPDQVKQALNALGPGRVIEADKFYLETAREGFYILPRTSQQAVGQWRIPGDESFSLPEANLQFRTEGYHEQSVIPPDQNTGIIDADLLEFPLTVRYRRPGDSYRPLGLKGTKKLSDLFIDAKVPVHKKDRTPIIISGRDICWVAGFRISDEFKVTSKTRKILIIEYKAPR